MPRPAKQLGAALYRKGDWPGAIEAYGDAIRRAPDHFQAQFNLGLALLRHDEHEKAIEAFERAIQLGRDRDPGQEYVAEAPFQLALALDRKGDRSGAISAYGGAVECHPDHFQAQFHLGLALLRNGEGEEAIRPLERTIELGLARHPGHPHLFEAYLSLGQLYHHLGKPERSIDLLEKAVALNPDHPVAVLVLGHGYRLVGRLSEAVDTLRKAIALDGKDVDARYQLAWALTQIGRPEAVIEECRKLLELDEDHATAHLLLGRALLNCSQRDEAVEYCVKGWELGSRSADWPDAAGARRTVAAAYYELGRAFHFGLGREPDPDQAIAAYEKTIEFGATGEEYRNLAWIHAQRGDYPRVVSLLEQAHEIGSRWWCFSSANSVEDWRSIAERTDHFLALLDGRATSEDGIELRQAATLGYFRHRHVAAERLWRAAFAVQPAMADDPRRMNRYQAARAAALAGCGRGEGAAELDEEAREPLRLGAAEWLRAELAFVSSRIAEGDEASYHDLMEALGVWKNCQDLAAVREAPALEQWSKLEQDDWRELWAEVEELLGVLRESPASKHR
jgi:tetratricopeptide (TPR) repeat protein